MTRRVRLQRKLQRNGVPRAAARAMVTVHMRTRIPLSVIVALVEQESSFRNVWGCDPAPNGGTGGLCHKPVTRRRYLTYRGARGRTGRGGMQGVGYTQLTWYSFQDAADKLGGCWQPIPNITVGASLVWKLIRDHGRIGGLRRYNGSGPAADRYAQQVNDRIGRWHKILTTKG
jgi:hypothetical protein